MKTLLIALTLLASSAPALSFACSCMQPGSTNFVAPADGAVDVPTNALVWVGGAFTGGLFDGAERFAIEVVSADQVPLPGVEGRLHSNMDLIDVFTPDMLLTSGTRYEVRVGEQVVSTFTTGDSDDTEAPPMPQETERFRWSRLAQPPGFQNSCGGAASYGFSFTYDLGDGVIAMIDHDGLADVDIDLIEGSVPSLTPFGSGSLSRGGGCGGSNWDNAAPGVSTDMRVGSFDVAGNFSGWSEDESITIPPAGCSAAGSSAPVGMLALLMLSGLIGVRRRS